MKLLDPVSLDYFDTAPMRIVASARLSATPERVFESLADVHDWPRWFPLMVEARWTRGEGGVDAEREVGLRLLGRFRERMLVWERGKRFAFTMIGSSSPLATHMAEDYQLTRDGSGTRLDWVFAATPTSLGKLAAPGMRAFMKKLFERGGANLEHLLSAN